jgi:hypothetical protein
VTQHFEEIPIEVWKLFDEIMDFGEPVKLLSPTERTHALSLAWGWSPPLLQHGSRTLLTQHGLAAVAWRRLLVASQGAPLNRVGIGPLSFVPPVLKGEQPKPKGKPGPKSTADRDIKIATEYSDGLNNGQWKSQAEYLRKKHARRWKQNQNNAKSWLSQTLKRAKAAGHVN